MALTVSPSSKKSIAVSIPACIPKWTHISHSHEFSHDTVCFPAKWLHGETKTSDTTQSLVALSICKCCNIGSSLLMVVEHDVSNPTLAWRLKKLMPDHCLLGLSTQIFQKRFLPFHGGWDMMSAPSCWPPVSSPNSPSLMSAPGIRYDSCSTYITSTKFCNFQQKAGPWKSIDFDFYFNEWATQKPVSAGKFGKWQQFPSLPHQSIVRFNWGRCANLYKTTWIVSQV